MSLSLLNRYAFFAGCIVLLLVLPFVSFDGQWLAIGVVAVLVVIGLIDIGQKRHSVRRNSMPRRTCRVRSPTRRPREHN